MNEFIEGGRENYVKESKAAQKKVVAELQTRRKAAATPTERAEIERALAEKKREHAEELRAAQRSMFLGS